jgi:uncharacterized repeat protein (TIGR01451 family)
MNPRHLLVPVLVLLPAAALGQVGVPPPLPHHGPAPLLFVRFGGPAGVRTTFYQGRPEGRSFDGPVVVGLRPGYPYRFQVSHLPERPGVSFFPTVEVRGTLALSPQLAAGRFPAPVLVTDEDVRAVLAGSLVTKVVYLEDPERAVPTATRPDQPLEITLPPTMDLLCEARQRGRILLIVRLGGRQLVSADELACESAYGTMLFPGERVLGPPSRPPCLALDLRPPEEEVIHDGGDRGIRAGLDPAGNLLGLDPEDTVAEFTDSCGRRGLTCSNRVCLCVPRFAVLRAEVPLGISETVVAPGAARHVLAQERVEVRLPPLEAQKYEQLQALRGRKRPSVNVNVLTPIPIERIEVLEAQVLYLGPLELIGTKAILTLTEVERVRLLKQIEFARQLSSNVAPREAVGVVGTAVVGRIQGLEVVSAQAMTREIEVCCHEIPCPPDKPLVLIKCADRTSAQPGDVVTFMLRYMNQGGKPITDVAVSDSLSPRLEYVPGTAQSDRPAVFTTAPNEVGSQVLRWEVSGTLQPGASGALRFKARVR